MRTQRVRARTTDYLFVCGPEGGARRYRCDHQAEQLRLAGESAHVGYHAELDPRRLAGLYRTVVLYRVPWDDKVEAWLDSAKTQGTRVLGDVDDLVFDVEYAGEIRALAQLSEPGRAEYIDRIERLCQTLRAVDGVVVSTEPLRAAATRINPCTAVSHNTVSRQMVSAGARARVRANDRHDRLVIAYLSGTPTHDRDFAEAADAVVSLLEEETSAEFWAVGYLNADERFDAFGDRVRRIAPLPFRKLPALLAQIDINLAPLELGNRFVDGKSCIKYLEAAVVAVPTVASPTADFRRAIVSGECGFLAVDPTEWSTALQALAESRSLRSEVGAAAAADVAANHTTVAAARAAGRMFDVLGR